MIGKIKYSFMVNVKINEMITEAVILMKNWKKGNITEECTHWRMHCDMLGPLTLKDWLIKCKGEGCQNKVQNWLSFCWNWWLES